MEDLIPFFILLIIPILTIFRYVYHLFDYRTNEIKRAKTIKDLTFSSFSNGYRTTGYFHRFINLLIVYFSFLSVTLTPITIPLFITIIFLMGIFLLNRYSKVLIFHNDSFRIQPYIRFLGGYYEFEYNNIDKVDYLVAGRGTAEIRICMKDGQKRKIVFRPGFFANDKKLITLILNEKLDLRTDIFRIKNYLD